MVCFIHIEKTGGTSVVDALRKAGVAVHHCDTLIPKEVPAGTQVIAGHLSLNACNLIKAKYVTVLRNPVDRIISYCNQILGNPKHAFYPCLRTFGIVNFLRVNHELCRTTIFRVTGRHDASPEEAIKKLRSTFEVVGTFNRLQKFYDTCVEKFNWPLVQLPHANKSVSRLQVSTEDVTKIRDLCKDSLKVFNSFRNVMQKGT